MLIDWKTQGKDIGYFQIDIQVLHNLYQNPSKNFWRYSKIFLKCVWEGKKEKNRIARTILWEKNKVGKIVYLISRLILHLQQLRLFGIGRLAKK